eukprot:15965-Heterococcus_DN1.PRE.3
MYNQKLQSPPGKRGSLSVHSIGSTFARSVHKREQGLKETGAGESSVSHHASRCAKSQRLNAFHKPRVYFTFSAASSMSHGVAGSSGLYLLESPQPLANVEEESDSSGEMSTNRCVWVGHMNRLIIAVSASQRMLAGACA